jgi:hypothetical protein
VSSIVILFLLVQPVYTYAYQRNEIHSANLTREIQLLLSLKSLYTGPVDGRCSKETKHAIETYESRFATARPNASIETSCNAEFLSNIKNDLKSILTSDTLDSSASVTGEKNQTFPNAEIDDLKTSIKYTNAALKGMTDGLAANFMNQYNSLASIGISAFVAAIAAVIAIISLTSALLREFITKSAEKSHNDLLKESQNKLSRILCQAKYEVDISHASLLTQIYARLSRRMLYSPLQRSAVST